MTPLAYSLHHLNYLVFGRDEARSRVIPAVLGTAGVVLTFLLLIPANGLTTALVTSLLLAFWSEHIFFSQNNRFYIIAAFFAFLCILVGSFDLRKSRIGVPLAALALAIAALSALVYVAPFVPPFTTTRSNIYSC